ASKTNINGSQLNKADSLLAQIQKRLDVAERVLAHEGDFVGIVEDSPAVDAESVMAEVDEYFGDKATDVEVASHSDSQ
ncbi:hypothetical protein OAH18_00775, partial [bacterium]|nr:hypothetical protein [bacterium]